MSERKDSSPNQNKEKQDNDCASLTSPGLSAVSFQLASPQGHATFQYRKKECCLDPATDSLDLSISFGPSPEKKGKRSMESRDSCVSNNKNNEKLDVCSPRVEKEDSAKTLGNSESNRIVSGKNKDDMDTVVDKGEKGKFSTREASDRVDSLLDSRSGNDNRQSTKCHVIHRKFFPRDGFSHAMMEDRLSDRDRRGPNKINMETLIVALRDQVRSECTRVLEQVITDQAVEDKLSYWDEKLRKQSVSTFNDIGVAFRQDPDSRDMIEDLFLGMFDADGKALLKKMEVQIMRKLALVYREEKDKNVLHLGTKMFYYKGDGDKEVRTKGCVGKQLTRTLTQLRGRMNAYRGGNHDLEFKIRCNVSKQEKDNGVTKESKQAAGKHFELVEKKVVLRSQRLW